MLFRSQPRQASGAAGENEEADDDSDYDVPGSKIKKWFGKLTARLKAYWCFKTDLQDIMYYQHCQDKKSRQRQKAIMRKLNIPVSNGSEGQITDKEQWVSNQKWPESSTDDNISPPPAHEDDEEEDDKEYEE